MKCFLVVLIAVLAITSVQGKPRPEDDDGSAVKVVENNPDGTAGPEDNNGSAVNVVENNPEIEPNNPGVINNPDPLFERPGVNQPINKGKVYLGQPWLRGGQ